MITKKEILNMAHHIVRRDAGIPDRQMMHPVRDWFIGLMTITLIFIAGMVYAAYVFMEFDSKEDSYFYESALKTYEQERVQEALDMYRNREVQFNALRNDRSRVTSQVPVIDLEDNEPSAETEVPETNAIPLAE